MKIPAALRSSDVERPQAPSTQRLLGEAEDGLPQRLVAVWPTTAVRCGKTQSFLRPTTPTPRPRASRLFKTFWNDLPSDAADAKMRIA